MGFAVYFVYQVPFEVPEGSGRSSQTDWLVRIRDTCTFRLRLRAGINTPSTWLKAVGPCCCPLMKKVSVCLFRSNSTPTVAPLHTPPSVLKEKHQEASALCHMMHMIAEETYFKSGENTFPFIPLYGSLGDDFEVSETEGH